MKTFLLGVGAQKAGTTWLHRYLQSFDNTDLGFAKEYHIWDALHCPECSRFQITSRLPLRPNKFRRWRMQRNPDYYFDYFQGLLEKDGVNLTGDITPSYSCLTAPVFQQIREGFEARGIELKVIFLMRDPVQRCWSVVRMHNKKGKSRDNIDVTLSEEKALISYYNSLNARIRTNYHRTIQELNSSPVPEENIFYGIYEELFTLKEITRLSHFLGLEPNHDFSGNRFNATNPDSALSDNTIQLISQEYKPVYEYCAKKFPQTQTLWEPRGFQSKPVT